MDAPQGLVLVDGNNVMGSRPDGWWRNRGQAMSRLVEELALLMKQAGGQWTVVFDGHPRQGLTGPSVGLRVEYALRAGVDSADDRIVEMVAQTPQKSAVLVYTSDRALRHRILALGARVEGSSVLLKALNKQP